MSRVEHREGVWQLPREKGVFSKLGFCVCAAVKLSVKYLYSLSVGACASVILTATVHILPLLFVRLSHSFGEHPPETIVFRCKNATAPFVHLHYILLEMLYTHATSLWSASLPCMCQSTFGSLMSFQDLFLKWAALKDKVTLEWYFSFLFFSYCIGRWMWYLSLDGRGRYSFAPFIP